MKPLRLEMEAFGPYKDNTVIDFEKLASSGVYLISGNTGSGKSFIFDAILFALFKNVSGSTRKENSVRCDFADPKTLTKVIFDFEVRGEKWHIERIIQQKADGTSKSKREMLQGPHGEIYELKKDIDSKVEELLGLSKKDFITIAMIAQGEFRKVLSSPTNERTILFRNIFDTGIYEKIQTELAHREDQLRAQLANDHIEMMNDLKMIAVDSDSDVYRIIQSALESDYIDEEIIALLENLVFEEDRNLKDSRALVEKMQEQLHAQSERCKELEQAEKLRNEIRELAENIERNTSERNRLLDHAQHFNEMISFESKLDAKVHTLNDELTECKNLEKLADVIHKHEEEYASLVSSYDALANQLSVYTRDVAEHERYLVEHKSAGVDLANKNAERASVIHDYDIHLERVNDFNEAHKTRLEVNKLVEELTEKKRLHKLLEDRLVVYEQTRVDMDRKIVENEEKLKQKPQVEYQIKIYETECERLGKELCSLYEWGDNIDQQTTLLQDIVKRLEVKNDEVIEQETIWNNLYKSYLAEQAALLGTKLKENSPCPVCGSLDHPHIAQPSDLCPSDKDLDDAQSVLNNLKEQHSQIHNEFVSAKSELEVSQKAFKQKLAEYGGFETLEEKIRGIRSLLNKENEKLAQLKLRDQILAEHKKNYNKFLKDIDELSQEIDNSEKLVSDLDRRVASLSGIANQQESRLLDFDIDDEKSLLDVAKSKLMTIDAEIDLLQDMVDQVERRQHSLEKLKGDIVKIESDCNSIEADKIKANADLLTQRALYEQRKNKLSDLDISRIEQQIEQAKEELLQSQKKRHDIQEALDEVTRIVNYDTGLKATKDEALASIEPGDLLHALERRDSLELEYESQKNKVDNLFEAAARNKSTYERISTRYDMCKKSSKEYQIVKSVYEIANGKTSGHKVKFESYLQGMYLDRVLIEANKRFSKMTSGRYRLVRSKSTGGNKATGLDIDVLDTHSNNVRSSSTLSGGESFKASLSLALGLSDVARMHAGGISVDCMFIDEGFGTLDDESRRSAIETLCELSKGNKSVGIISHVSELKEFIDNQVLVTNDESGSHVKLIV